MASGIGPPAADSRRRPGGAVALVVGLLAGLLVSQYGYGLTAPFINDDYIFLDKTRAAPLASLWAPRELLFHYYRPWSRELHFAVLQRLFGPRELPFHAASFGLWLAVMGLWFTLARRLGGLAVASVATACTAALSAWAVPVLWASGAQDLWMLLFALLSILALVDDRPGWSAVSLALALLSKETAVVIPAIAVVYLLALGRLRWGAALRRTAPLWVVTAAWAAWHPLVGGRLWSPFHEPFQPGVHPPAWTIAGQTVLSLFNLVPWPQPESGWMPVLGAGLPAVALLLVLAAWGTSGAGAGAGPERGRGQTPPGPALATFGLAWALLGWLPLALPSIAWRSHYGLFGALGAWLAIAAWLVPHRRWALAVVATLALLRPAVGDTPSHDWSSEWYRRRAAAFIGVLRADLLRQQPRPSSYSRIYFVRVPSEVGFLAGNGPALRVWFADPTLRGGFYTDYRARSERDPPGPDLFFRYDSTAGWVKVVSGAEDVTSARLANPRWERDHRTLAATLAGAEDWAPAAAEYAKLAGAVPTRVDYAYDAGVCCESSGDSTAAARWYARAASLPGADDEVRQTAQRLARHLRAPR
jgi:hypothetical protein